MLEIWGIRSIPSLPLFPGSVWPGVVATDSVLFMGQIELTWVFILNWIVWNRTVFDIETITDVKPIFLKKEQFLTLEMCIYVKLNCLK